MIRLLTVGVAAAIACVACASTPVEQPRNFVVIEENVTIPSYSSNAVSGFERVDDDTYLLRVNANRWYKAELSENCGRGARNWFAIRVDTGRDPTSTIDTFTTLVLDETHHCRIQKLDRIEPPRSALDA